MKMKIKKMKNYKTTKEKWELKMKEKEPLQCWIVKIIDEKIPVSPNVNCKVGEKRH